MNFRKDILTDKKLYVNCKTYNEAVKLLTWAHNNGKTWCTGKSFEDNIFWYVYESDTLYVIASGEYANSSFVDSVFFTGRKVISFEEAICTETSICESPETFINLREL